MRLGVIEAEVRYLYGNRNRVEYSHLQKTSVETLFSTSQIFLPKVPGARKSSPSWFPKFSLHHLFGTNEPFNLLLRPDNHIAFISAVASPDVISDYLDRFVGYH